MWCIHSVIGTKGSKAPHLLNTFKLVPGIWLSWSWHTYKKTAQIWPERKLWRFVKKLFNNRSQYVQIEEDISSTQLIKCGVSRGSALGPVLFSLYINDLPSTTNFFTRLYADDTALFMFDKNLYTLNKRVNDELVNIDNWLKSNKLTPNYTKTKFMIISLDKNAKSNFEVTINKVPISYCNSYKYLCIIFDDDLKWKTHFEHVSKKNVLSCWHYSKTSKLCFR